MPESLGLKREPSTRIFELFWILSTLRFVPCARMDFPLPSMTPRPRIFVFWIWNRRSVEC